MHCAPHVVIFTHNYVHLQDTHVFQDFVHTSLTYAGTHISHWPRQRLLDCPLAKFEGILLLARSLQKRRGIIEWQWHNREARYFVQTIQLDQSMCRGDDVAVIRHAAIIGTVLDQRR